MSTTPHALAGVKPGALHQPELAQRIAKNDAFSLRMAKRAVNQTLDIQGYTNAGLAAMVPTTSKAMVPSQASNISPTPMITR